MAASSPDPLTAPPDHYVYPDGALIDLDYYPEAPSASTTPGGSHSTMPTPLTVRVVRTLATTFSCVLLVEPVSPPPPAPPHAARGSPKPRRPPAIAVTPPPPLPPSLILKLLDRRFATHLRADYNAAPWTPATEHLLSEFDALPEKRRPWVRLPGVGSEDGQADSWTYSADTYAGGDSDTESSGNTSGGSSTEDAHSGGKQKQIRIPNTQWSVGHREAYLQLWAARLYAQEVAVYRALEKVQGEQVPLLYGTVRVREGTDNVKPRTFDSGGHKRRRSKSTAHTKSTPNAHGRTPASIEGLLLQYLSPAFSLRALPQHIPYLSPTAGATPSPRRKRTSGPRVDTTNASAWAGLARAAVRLVQEIGDMGVVNADARLDNILVVPASPSARPTTPSALDDAEPWEVVRSPSPSPPAPTTYKLYMLDFGLARVRRADESAEAFRRARRERDEEGAVGWVLQALLLKAVRGHGGLRESDMPWRFVHSRRLERESDEEEEYGVGF